MNPQRIIIGTRGSDLALKQTDLVKQLLLGVDAALEVEVQIIVTGGDVNQAPITSQIMGKGLFTKEIEEALLRGEIDIAVHSLKDLPEKLPDGLVVGAIAERADPRSVLVSRSGATFDALPSGAVIGTDSALRKSLILRRRPDLRVESIRGNVPTRLAKLDAGGYDALLLAAAGLHRLGLESRITEYLEVDDFVPAPGQGAMAVETRADNAELLTLLSRIAHRETTEAIMAERAFSAAAGGGCKTPVGAYARVEGETLTLIGMIGAVDGASSVQKSISGAVAESADIGKRLAAIVVPAATEAGIAPVAGPAQA